MKVTRFSYVQGVGKRKHILLGKPGEDTVCKAWYWGRSRTNGTADPTRPDAEVCKHCLRLLDKIQLK